MKFMGMPAIIGAVVGVAVIMLIDVVMGRPFMIGWKSIVGLAVCGVLLLLGIRNTMRKSQA